MTTATKPEIPPDVEPDEYFRLAGPEALGATPEPYPEDPRFGPWRQAIPAIFTTPVPNEVAELEAEYDQLSAELASIERDVAEAVVAGDLARAAELRQRQKMIPERLEAVTVPLLAARNNWHRATCRLLAEHEAQLTKVVAHWRRVVAEVTARLRDVDLALTHFTVQRHRYEDQVRANDRRIAAILSPSTTVHDLIEEAVTRYNHDPGAISEATPVTLDRSNPANDPNADGLAR